MNVSSMDALLDHPHADDLRGVINMDGQDGEATNQGPLAGWLHGDAGRRMFSPREAFLDAVPATHRPALILEGGAEPLMAVGEAMWADVIPVPPMSVTAWEVEGNGVVWTDLHYGWPADLVTSTSMEWGDTLSTYTLSGEAVAYNNEDLDYWSEPFEIIDRYELARYITPYGINLTLGPDGWAWVFDVTDYAPSEGQRGIAVRQLAGAARFEVCLHRRNATSGCRKRDRFLEGDPLPQQLGRHHFAPNLHA